MKVNRKQLDNKVYLEYLFDKTIKDNQAPKKTKKDIAKKIIEQLESDDELMKEFNTLLRKKKLANIKKK